MKKTSVFITALFAVVLCLADDVATNRPSSWAQPVPLEGVPNLHKMSDMLYRSAQPTDKGMQNLDAMGIKTIVNLRTFHSDRDEIKGTKLDREHIRMQAWHPEREDVIQVLKIVTDPTRQPVLVHCQHGADRTGTMCAIYRIVVQDWTKEAAIREMIYGGYNFHDVWQNLPKWIEKLDVESIRREAGIATPPPEDPSAQSEP